MKNPINRFGPGRLMLLGASLLLATPVALAAQQNRQPPNIIFIMMDDVGIDQLTAFPAVPSPSVSPRAAGREGTSG